MAIIKTRTFIANEGDPSVGNAGPDAIETDLDNLYDNSEELEGIANALQTSIDNIVAGGTIPLDHSSADTIYGLGDADEYGHVMVVNNLTEGAYADGKVLSAYQGKALKDTIDGKAPISHANAAATYGVGTAANYGHIKTVDNLTTDAYADGQALSPHQGYVLDQKITNLMPKTKLAYSGSILPASETLNAISFDSSKYNFINIRIIRGSVNGVSNVILDSINHIMYINYKYDTVSSIVEFVIPTTAVATGFTTKHIIVGFTDDVYVYIYRVGSVYYISFRNAETSGTAAYTLNVMNI